MSATLHPFLMCSDGDEPQEGRSVRGAGVLAGAPDFRVRDRGMDERLPRA